MRFWVSCLGVIFCAGLIGCDSNGFEELVEDQIENATEQQAMASAAVLLTNQARSQSRQCGSETYDAVGNLSWNEQLAEAALAHSVDMASRNYFDHTNPDGENPGARIARTGYDAQTWGENIAAGYATVEQAIAGWLNSPGHCANIMNGNFTEFAVMSARSENSAYGTYWTMVLGAR